MSYCWDHKANLSHIGYSESKLVNLAYSNSEKVTSPAPSGSAVTPRTWTNSCEAEAIGIDKILS